jgi:hypothetical protein
MNDIEFEQIGRALFGTYQVRLNHALERMDYSDDVVYDGTLERFLVLAFQSGWSINRTIQTLLVLDDAGILKLSRVSRPG